MVFWNRRAKMQLKSKILVLLMAPLIVLTISLMQNIAASYDQFNRSKELSRSVNTSIHLGQLIHSLQLERGSSAAYASSKSSHFQNLMAQKRQKVAAAVKTLEEDLEGKKTAFAAANLRFIFLVENLKTVRKQIDNGKLDSSGILEGYSKIIATGITVFSEIESLSIDFGAFKILRSYTEVLKLKETLGQERGLVGSFRNKEKRDLHKKEWSFLISQEEFHLNTLRSFSDSHLQKVINNFLTSSFLTRRNELRRMMKNEYSQANTKTWFKGFTDLIENIHKLEKNLAFFALDHASKEKDSSLMEMLFSLFLAILSSVIVFYFYRKISIEVTSSVDKVTVALNSYKENWSYKSEKNLLSYDFEKILRLIDEHYKSMRIAEKDLKESVEKANALSHAKSDFLTNMSHEVRTPLNGILGYAELALDSVELEEYDTLKVDLEKIVSSGRYLLSIFQQIFDLSVIESGDLTIDASRFPWQELSMELENEFSKLFCDHNNKLVFDAKQGADFLVTDRAKLKKILQSVLHNALKFTKDGMVYVKVVEQPSNIGDNVVVTIKDNGPGISPEHIEKIFDKFTQTHDIYANPLSGAGLGLALARKLSEALGGRVYVESVLGSGSTFTIVIPKEFSSTKKAA